MLIDILIVILLSIINFCYSFYSPVLFTLQTFYSKALQVGEQGEGQKRQYYVEPTL